MLAGCATSLSGATGGVLEVAASVNTWGSILAQLGGTHVQATSIINSPATDPHDYEPTPADGRVIARARLFVENGVGYDSWAARALAASPDSQRRVVDVGALVGVPDDGNPHRWYDPANVSAVAAAITGGLKRLDPADAGYFDRRLATFEQHDLAQYHQLIDEIARRYAGTRVGASESIFAPLAAALRLQLVTPPAFLRAVSEGSDPSAADKAAIDAQIAHRAIAVYVLNTQNSTPDVAAQVAACRQRGIPVVGITETLVPAGASFQRWQVSQLESLLAALGRAKGGNR
jgi:zinc/manganese transport system substrate-binding protein